MILRCLNVTLQSISSGLKHSQASCTRLSRKLTIFGLVVPQNYILYGGAKFNVAQRAHDIYYSKFRTMI